MAMLTFLCFIAHNKLCDSIDMRSIFAVPDLAMQHVQQLAWSTDAKLLMVVMDQLFIVR